MSRKYSFRDIFQGPGSDNDGDDENGAVEVHEIGADGLPPEIKEALLRALTGSGKGKQKDAKPLGELTPEISEKGMAFMHGAFHGEKSAFDVAMMAFEANDIGFHSETRIEDHMWFHVAHALNHIGTVRFGSKVWNLGLDKAHHTMQKKYAEEKLAELESERIKGVN